MVIIVTTEHFDVPLEVYGVFLHWWQPAADIDRLVGGLLASITVWPAP